MGSVAKPRCARGQNCSHIRDFPHIDKPIKVLHEGALCDRCQRAEHDVTAFPEPEHQELLRAARALLDDGIENEDEIIPTLVLAANVSQMPRLEDIRDELVKAGRESKARAELDSQLYSVSGGWMWSSGRVVDGVPLIRRAPLWITGAKDKRGQIEEIAIDVFKRSVTCEEVGKWYEWYLKLVKHDYDLNDLSRGVVAYKTDNQEFFRLIARPEERSVDPDGGVSCPSQRGYASSLIHKPWRVCTKGSGALWRLRNPILYSGAGYEAQSSIHTTSCQRASLGTLEAAGHS
jgi:hypothetical protein